MMKRTIFGTLGLALLIGSVAPGCVVRARGTMTSGSTGVDNTDQSVAVSNVLTSRTANAVRQARPSSGCNNATARRPPAAERAVPV